jgi:predicted TIM-barrel fold metal-dependent hydrolase
MPLQDHMKLISVDDHVIEHPTVWQDRLPAKHRDAGPRVLVTDGTEEVPMLGRLPAGRDVWLYQGELSPQVGLNAVAGKPYDQFGIDPYRFDDMRPGCYDPVERLADMDIDGVWAQTTFPSLPGFGGRFFATTGTDFELAHLCIQAWNDFIIDEWAAADPDRFVPLMLLPLWDVDASVAEIGRMASKGSKGISFVENLTPLGLPSWHSDHWDPVFAAAQEAGLPLCLHFGSSGAMPSVSEGAPFPVLIALSNTASMATCIDPLFSPVFHKFPGLQVALSEGGIGWVPWLLERVDLVWERHRHYTGIPFDTRPSDLFRQNMWGCFIDDQCGIDLRDRVGVDRITWEGDYPHADSNWPNSRKVASDLLADVSDEDAHKIAELNARTLFSF